MQTPAWDLLIASGSSEPVSWLPSVLEHLRAEAVATRMSLGHLIVRTASSNTGIATSVSLLTLSELKKQGQRAHRYRKKKHKSTNRHTSNLDRVREDMQELFEGRSLEIWSRVLLLVLADLEPSLVPQSQKNQLLVLSRNQTLNSKNMEFVMTKLDPVRLDLLRQLAKIFSSEIQPEDLFLSSKILSRFIFGNVDSANLSQLATIFVDICKNGLEYTSERATARRRHPATKEALANNSSSRRMKHVSANQKKFRSPNSTKKQSYNFQKSDSESSFQPSARQRLSLTRKSPHAKKPNSRNRGTPKSNGKISKHSTKRHGKASSVNSRATASDEKSMREVIRKSLKEDLKLFFLLRDSGHEHVVEALFSYYQFDDIVKGVHFKYKILPSGWRSTITKNQVLMRELGQVRYLDETTLAFPKIRGSNEFLFPSERREPLDYIVDEFINVEKGYYEKLKCLLDNYVVEITAVAMPKVGETAREALGLTSEEVDSIFGKSFSNLVTASKGFITLLDTLVWVRGPINPRIVGDRVGILMDIVRKCAPTLISVYTPYLRSFQKNQVLLRELEKKIQKRASTDASNMDPTSPLNFLQLFDQISAANESIRGKALDSLLNMPVRQFPSYKTLLERLEKDGSKPSRAESGLPVPHPGVPKVKATLELVLTLINRMDKEIM